MAAVSTVQEGPSAPAKVAGPDPAGGAPPAVADPAPQAPKRPSRARRFLLPVLLLVLALGGWQAYSYWWDAQHYVSTDNAQVSGQQIQVGSMEAGRITRIDVGVGSTVRRDQPLARVELPTQVAVAQNGAPKLAFLPDANSFVEVRSPIDGVVIATPGAVGATVAQGQAVVTLVDPSRLWVTANVDETSLARLRVGQAAEVSVDALDRTIVGKVEALTPATAASFSLIPSSSNTTSNFTKVTQVVPVRVAVPLGSQPGLLGGSASVRIRVAD
jgi:multidrug resistance efflux pump